jgi:Leucine-rich repeat (LRR) protein
MPPSMFTDYDVPDHRLRGCLVQTISDQQVTEAAQLRHLNCSSAGISQLTGLTRFHALEELNLASNNLREVPELATLSRLRILILRDNPLTDASPLLRLLNLQQLDLSQTPDLTCPDVLQLAEGFTGELILPEQCQ